MQESRNHIATRLLKVIAREWGEHIKTGDENYFGDPLVSMLVRALSAELEKIYSEIQATRARVLERMEQQLLPDVLTGAQPAHAIACALPVDAATELDTNTQCGTEKNASCSKEFFFSPTGSFRLNRSSIRFIATGTHLFQITNKNTKELIARSDAGKELPASTIFLALDNPGVGLHRSLFYFDFPNEAEKEGFYYHLPNASWHFGNELLQHESGYGKQQPSDEPFTQDIIQGNQCYIGKRIKKQINNLYKRFFISLLDTTGITEKNGEHSIPEEIAQAFSSKDAQVLQDKPLRWLRIHFPKTIPNHFLEEVSCTMNCFPVMNCRLHTIHYRLQDIVNIIPLSTEELFFDVEEVMDDEGKLLNVQSTNQAKDPSIALLMRNGGVGRFDERDAAALIDHLLQLLQDEKVAFSALGSDFMSHEIKQLQQVMNRLEQRLSSRPLHREPIPYLVIPNHKEQFRHCLYIKYWTTSGKEANTIKSGTTLTLYKGGFLEGNRATLVTTTQGGRNKLNATESALAYKSALLSKDRIITAEDIKAFCHYRLGAQVKSIEVQKGYTIHPDQQQGYIKTIDVIITMDKKAHSDMMEKGEVGFQVDELKLLLEEKSALWLPYRIRFRANN